MVIFHEQVAQSRGRLSRGLVTCFMILQGWKGLEPLLASCVHPQGSRAPMLSSSLLVRSPHQHLCVRMRVCRCLDSQGLGSRGLTGLSCLSLLVCRMGQACHPSRGGCSGVCRVSGPQAQESLAVGPDPDVSCTRCVLCTHNWWWIKDGVGVPLTGRGFNQRCGAELQAWGIMES